MQKKLISNFRVQLRKLERHLNEHLQKGIKSCGVSMVQCHTLLEIKRLKKTSIKELSENLDLDKSTVSRIVDALVNKRIVERRPDPQNRRFVMLVLTFYGKQQVDRINDFCDKYYEKLFNFIPSELHSQIIENIYLFTEALSRLKEELQFQGIDCIDHKSDREKLEK